MELNRSVWYVRLFFWSLRIWGAFRNDDHRYDVYEMEKRGTNLCFFVRVMIVYMPLVLLTHVAFVVAAVASLTVLPIYLFGGINYGWLLVVIAVVTCTLKGIGVAERRVAERKHMWVKLMEHERETQQATESGGPGFFGVLWAYLVATKKKVCPLIVFLAPKGLRQ
jgi:hypothetical protein